MDLRPLACCDCGFESLPWCGCLFVANVVCCQVEVSATVRSFYQRSPSVIKYNNNPLHLHCVRRKEVRMSKKEILSVFLWKK